MFFQQMWRIYCYMKNIKNIDEYLDENDGECEFDDETDY